MPSNTTPQRAAGQAAFEPAALGRSVPVPGESTAHCNRAASPPALNTRAWSAGVGLTTPWATGHFRASGAYGAEVGMQRWGQEGSVFVDVALGAARTTSGEWHGRRVVPTARIAVGHAWPF